MSCCDKHGFSAPGPQGGSRAQVSTQRRVRGHPSGRQGRRVPVTAYCNHLPRLISGRGFCPLAPNARFQTEQILPIDQFILRHAQPHHCKKYADQSGRAQSLLSSRRHWCCSPPDAARKMPQPHWGRSSGKPSNCGVGMARTALISLRHALAGSIDGGPRDGHAKKGVKPQGRRQDVGANLGICRRTVPAPWDRLLISTAMSIMFRCGPVGTDEAVFCQVPTAFNGGSLAERSCASRLIEQQSRGLPSPWCLQTGSVARKSVSVTPLDNSAQDAMRTWKRRRTASFSKVRRERPVCPRRH